MFSLSNFLIYFILPLFTLFYLFMKWKFSYFDRKGIPHNPQKFYNLLGDLNGVGTKVHIFNRLQEMYEKFKEKDVIFGFYNSMVPNFIVTNEELVRLIMIKDFNNFVNRGMYFNDEDEPLTGERDV